jgi:hypothetical protein
VEGLIFLALVIFIVIKVASLFDSKPSRKLPPKIRPNETRFNKTKSSGKSPSNNFGLADPTNQLNAISKVNFEKKRLLNASEYRVFRTLEALLNEIGQGHRLMAQTSLGELIKPSESSGDWKERKDAFASINSKRLDFAIIDKFGILAVAIEYQGSGHYHHQTFMRDAVKKEALRRANVPFLEVPKGMTPKELKGKVAEIISPNGQNSRNTEDKPTKDAE